MVRPNPREGPANSTKSRGVPVPGRALGSGRSSMNSSDRFGNRARVCVLEQHATGMTIVPAYAQSLRLVAFGEPGSVQPGLRAQSHCCKGQEGAW